MTRSPIELSWTAKKQDHDKDEDGNWHARTSGAITSGEKSSSGKDEQARHTVHEELKMWLLADIYQQLSEKGWNMSPGSTPELQCGERHGRVG